MHAEPSSGVDAGQSAEFMKPPAPKPPPIELRPPVPPLELPPFETEPPVLLLPLTPLPLGLLLVPATLADVPPVPALLGVVPPAPLLSAPPSLLPPHAMNKPKLIENSGKL